MRSDAEWIIQNATPLAAQMMVRMDIVRSYVEGSFLIKVYLYILNKIIRVEVEYKVIFRFQGGRRSIGYQFKID